MDIHMDMNRLSVEHKIVIRVETPNVKFDIRPL